MPTMETLQTVGTVLRWAAGLCCLFVGVLAVAVCGTTRRRDGGRGR